MFATLLVGYFAVGFALAAGVVLAEERTAYEAQKRLFGFWHRTAAWAAAVGGWPVFLCWLIATFDDR